MTSAEETKIENTEEKTGPDGSAAGRILGMLFFPLAVLFHELILQFFDKSNPFTGSLLIYILTFSLGAGFAVSFLLGFIRNRKIYVTAGSILCFLWTVFTIVEYGCKGYFSTYYSLSYSTSMAGNVFGSFFDTMLEIIAANIPFILLAFVPLVLFIVFRRQLHVPGRSVKWSIALLAVAVLLNLAGVLYSRNDSNRNIYTYDFNADAAVPKFGLVTELRLECQYGLFGMPEAPVAEIPVIIEEPVTEETEEDTEDSEEETVTYGYNVLSDLDLEALSESSDSNVAALSKYFNSLTPSQQNEYTGMFEGKNLILITAEAFSGYVIDEELTPTLYRLTHNGFVINNYYQPGWGQSTTGGEFAVMTGIIPTWINGSTAFAVSANDYMPFGLGTVFSDLGYLVPAWHNNVWDYYNRNLTHPNLGYDYKGIGHGLTLSSYSSGWPASDLEMVEVTIGQYIDDYVDTGTPFHAYYMTCSGHANYSWGGQAMSKKNQEAAQAAYPDASATVQAYVACQLELESALAYLVEVLEEAGIADDTVICLSADHYPYALAAGSVDYYKELTGIDDSEAWTSRYANSLILWCGSMEEEDPVVVDTPCSSIDIVPTLLNLFGIEYDSRLFSGRDILAANYEADKASTCMPLVILPTNYGYSWRTAAGTYETYTGTFTPEEGITVSEDYVDTVNALVKAKVSYASLLIKSDYFGKVFEEDDS